LTARSKQSGGTERNRRTEPPDRTMVRDSLAGIAQKILAIGFTNSVSGFRRGAAERKRPRARAI